MAFETLTMEVEIGELIRTHRERKGLIQRAVAARCGVDQKTYRAWEKGRVQPSDVMLLGLAVYLEIPLALLNELTGRYACSQLSFRFGDGGAVYGEDAAWMPTYSRSTSVTNGHGDSHPKRSAPTPRVRFDASGTLVPRRVSIQSAIQGFSTLSRLRPPAARSRMKAR